MEHSVNKGGVCKREIHHCSVLDCLSKLKIYAMKMLHEIIFSNHCFFFPQNSHSRSITMLERDTKMFPDIFTTTASWTRC